MLLVCKQVKKTKVWTEDIFSFVLNVSLKRHVDVVAGRQIRRI